MTRGTVFRDDAKAAGWSADLVTTGDREEVTAHSDKYGVELKMVWDAGRYNYPDSYQVRDGERRTIRNAAEARRILLGENGSTSGERRAPRPASRRKATPPTRDWEAEDRHQRPPTRRLPFRISQPDREILEAVLGKEVCWWNTKTRQVERSRVMPNPKQRHLQIINAKGKRILSWAGYRADSPGHKPIVDSFHAVYLDSIVEVR